MRPLIVLQYSHHQMRSTISAELVIGLLSS
jgi:hypothetical protein